MFACIKDIDERQLLLGECWHFCYVIRDWITVLVHAKFMVAARWPTQSKAWELNAHVMSVALDVQVSTSNLELPYTAGDW